MKEIDIKNVECYCEWPNKEVKKVVVLSVKDGMANIIWNDDVPAIPGDYTRVIGFDACVSLQYLYIPYCCI